MWQGSRALEVAAGEASASGRPSQEASPPDEDPAENKAGLREGDIARIQGLQGKPELNGHQVTLCRFDSGTARWRVALGPETEFSVRPRNLVLVPADEDRVDTAGEADQEHQCVLHTALELKRLLAWRGEVLRHAESATAAGGKKASALGRQLEDTVSHCRPRLEEYMRHSTPPANLGELRQRNQAREQLRGFARTVKDALEGVLRAFQEPSEALQTAEQTALQRLDILQSRLQLLRQETIRGFSMQAEKVKAGEQQCDAILNSVSPHVNLVDGFLRSLAKELEAESAAHREVTALCMAKLREEEALFVRANESPSQNPAFKKVRTEIEELEGSEHLRAERDAEAAEFFGGWESLLGELRGRSTAAAPSTAVPQEAVALRAEEPRAMEEVGPNVLMARRVILQAFWRFCTGGALH